MNIVEAIGERSLASIDVLITDITGLSVSLLLKGGFISNTALGMKRCEVLTGQIFFLPCILTGLLPCIYPEMASDMWSRTQKILLNNVIVDIKFAAL